MKHAKSRQATSHVKTRGEVSGGGRKPWRQKGTGRARAGSSRSPIWVGGGIVFGPSRDRNYQLTLPKKMNRAALKQLLEFLLQEKKLRVVESLAVKEPKTKLALDLLAKNEVSATEVALIVKKIEPELMAATNNLSGVNVITADTVSLLDVVYKRAILVEAAAAEQLGLAVAEKAPKAVEKKTPKSKTEKK